MTDRQNADERGLIPIQLTGVVDARDAHSLHESPMSSPSVIVTEERIQEYSTPEGTTRLLFAALFGLREIRDLVAEQNAISARQADAEERQAEAAEGLVREAVNSNELIKERNKIELRRTREKERRDLLDFVAKIFSVILSLLTTYWPAIVTVIAIIRGDISPLLGYVLGFAGVVAMVFINMRMLRANQRKRSNLK